MVSEIHARMSGCVKALEGIIKKADQKRKLEEEEKE